MDGFRAPGAWIDEVHSLPPLPTRRIPFSIEHPHQSLLADSISKLVTAQVRAQREWEAQNPPPPGYRWDWVPEPIDWAGIDRNEYRVSWRPHLVDVRL